LCGSTSLASSEGQYAAERECVRLDEPHILSKIVCNRQRERAARRASHFIKGSTQERVCACGSKSLIFSQTQYATERQCVRLEEPHILSSAVRNRESMCAARRASHSLKCSTQQSVCVCGSTSLTFSQTWYAIRRECVRLDEPHIFSKMVCNTQRMCAARRASK